MKINLYVAMLDKTEIMTVAGTSITAARENMTEVFKEYWPDRKLSEVELKEVSDADRPKAKPRKRKPPVLTTEEKK